MWGAAPSCWNQARDIGICLRCSSGTRKFSSVSRYRAPATVWGFPPGTGARQGANDPPRGKPIPHSNVTWVLLRARSTAVSAYSWGGSTHPQPLTWDGLPLYRGLQSILLKGGSCLIPVILYPLATGIRHLPPKKKTKIGLNKETPPVH